MVGAIVEISNNARYVISQLNKNGYQAFIVGGCVRDHLMGREATDYDITTSALPEQVKQVFSCHTVIETGIKHGTVTVLLGGEPFEITTYRTELGYSDLRHPDTVVFLSNINGDLSRRDFTMNAVAYNDTDGFIDLFGGIEDIKNKTIRAVGEPSVRFSEDALRILRALRFASTLGFKMEKNTANSVFLLAESVNRVSPERIYSELKKLLCGFNAHNVVTEYKEALEKILKIEINVEKEKLKALPNDFAMRFSYLCGENVTETLCFLRADNRTKQLCDLLKNSTPVPNDELLLKRYVRELGREDAEYVGNYRRALYSEDKSNNLKELLSSNTCLSISELDINGNDVLALGVPPREVGTLLSALLELVVAEELNNTKTDLINKVKELQF